MKFEEFVDLDKQNKANCDALKKVADFMLEKNCSEKYVPLEEAMDEGTLLDWYISSVSSQDEPVWTEEHIKELLNDYYVIPKEVEKISKNKLPCVNLPCDVGDMVYMVYAVSVDKWEVRSIEIYENDILLRLGHKGTDDYNAVWLKEKGERLFFNSKEAENRLKELQGGTK